jgi:uncharacterized membrane protein
MTWYEFLLFVHISATVIWVGGGFFSIVINYAYRRDNDVAAIERQLKDQEFLAQRLFIPSSMIVLIAGILLVIDAWSLDHLWIVLGLVGFAITFVTGLFMLKPESERIHAQIERDGRVTEATLTWIERFLTKARVDSVVLFLVIADMVLKPTGDEVGVLIGMAVIAGAGVAYIVVRLNAIDAREGRAPLRAET